MAINVYGNTVLHYACHFGYLELALELIRIGASPFSPNINNQTPVDLSKGFEFRRKILESIEQLKNYNVARSQFESETNTIINSNMLSYTNFDINIDDLPVEKMIESNYKETIWKGYWCNSSVIIKVIKVKNPNRRIANSFISECKKLKYIKNLNILPIIGYCVSLPDLIVLSQSIYYGSLSCLIHKQKVQLNSKLILNFAYDIASAMDYIHNQMESIMIFYQLSSKTIMVDEYLRIKLNMAEVNFSFNDQEKIINPAAFAPEALINKLETSSKKSSDMWIFAIILWELYNRKKPFCEYDFCPMKLGKLINMNLLRLEIKEDNSNHYQKLIRICMNIDPKKRPKFQMIMPILDKLKNSESG